jgi:hypothetical protein
MKERPILFNGKMVRAILDGRKTQTRRVIKPQPLGIDQYTTWIVNDAWQTGHVDVDCPYGAPGDRLWVRETFTAPMEYNGFKPSELPENCDFIYREESPGYRIKELGSRWFPSIFMPRWASRITLEVTAVRVERVQDISPKDALAEGDVEALTNPRHKETSIDWYHNLWDSINGAGSWASNPWVWVVEFRRIEQ